MRRASQPIRDVVRAIARWMPTGVHFARRAVVLAAFLAPIAVAAAPLDGDLNGDGRLDTGDARIALEIANGARSPTAFELEHGDVAPLEEAPEVPSTIDMGDAVLLLRAIRGEDVDGDGLGTEEEQAAGASPFRADTDRDTLLDVDELALGTDPAVSDTDGDGVSDASDPEPLVNDTPPPPPDAEETAAALDPTVATDVASATEFLHTGSDPIQTGVATGTIEGLRASVLRGVVHTRDGAPLPSVRIRVLDRPEFGETVTQADGEFDLVVNGGGRMVVRYEREGFLPVVRRVLVPWRDWVVLPDVVMIPRDFAATSVDLASGSVQTAQSSLVTDSRGSRRYSLVFPSTATATMNVDGSPQPVDELTVRATEYTVGDDALEALPAEIGSTIGPKAVFDLGADEAVQTGAESVTFSEPVPFYLDNFTGNDVGESVPLASYDDSLQAWLPEPSGIVLELAGVEEGLAQLDATGDGAEDSADAPILAEHGITDEERSAIAELFGDAPGHSFRRYRTTHFSGFCAHRPLVFPPGAERPPAFTARTAQGKDDCAKDCGSVIRVERQVLGERIDLVGTPFDLHYESDRTSGYAAARRIEIPVTDGSVPGPLERIEVEIRVAGRVLEKEVASPQPNDAVVFEWNGLDAYGRLVQGRQPVRAEVSYVYPASQAGARQEGRRSRTWKGEIGPWDARAAGLGGWTLSAQHAYDPNSRVLYRGDGERRTAADIPAIAEAARRGLVGRPVRIEVGQDGSVYYSETSHRGGGIDRVRRLLPDGSVETIAGDSELGRPTGLALGPDGSVYIGEQFDNIVWRVDPEGDVHPFAGTGEQGSSGDGGPATEATIGAPNGLAVGPDGSLYIADRAFDRVRRVSPDGTISTVAGNGGCGFSGMGGPATEACFNTNGIAVDDSGALYIATGGHGRVVRVGTDGIARVFAGGGSSQGDGGPATEANLNEPWDVALAPDGSVYILEFEGHRVRRVGPDKRISTVMGAGIRGFSGEGLPAVRTQTDYAWGITIGQRGELFVADLNNFRIWRVRPPLPGFKVGDIVVASEDGSELYVFDGTTGRHQETLDATTGAQLLSFAYTEEGRLDSITDADGNTTRVLRDASGAPTAIEGPFGQQTTLTLDAQGFLASVTNPDGGTYDAAYTTGGLLTELTTPDGHATSFEYTAEGRLERETDPAGGFKALARQEGPNRKRTVTVTTAMGRSYSNTVEPLGNGQVRDVRTDAAGLETVIEDGKLARRVTTTPDGTEREVELAADPRFGLAAPFAGQETVTTPAGLVFERTRSRTVSVDDATGTLESRTDTITVNGHPSRTVEYNFDEAAGIRTVTTTTPEGRLVVDHLDARGRVVQTETDGLEPVQLAYDEAGRLDTLTQGTGAAERVVSFEYDAEGQLESVTDPLTREVGFVYDDAGRVTEQSLPGGRTITFGYDANGNLTSLTPPGQPAHVFRYTARDQESEYEPPAVGAGDPRTLYTYNLDEQLTQVDRPDGTTIDLGYDAAGRLETVAIPRGTTTRSYDPATGNLESLTAPGGEALTFSYDGSLVTQRSWSGTVAGSVGRQHNEDLRVASQSVSGAHSVAFVYDHDGLLTDAGALALTRDLQHGLVTGTTLDTVTTSRTANAFGELASDGASAGGTALYSNSYQRDALGRITQKTETIQGTTTVYEYAYDAAGRLWKVHEDGALTATYGYDANGNRETLATPQGTVTGSYDAQDRLDTYGEYTYAQNAAGDRTSKTHTPTGATTSYQYDALGNLTQVDLPDSRTIEYAIDGRNRRVAKIVDGTLERAWLYQDGLNPVAELADTDGDGVAESVEARFVYGAKSNVPAYMVKDGTTYRILSDYLGSVRLVVNAATGAVAQRIDYDAFGRVTQDTNPGFQPFGYAGGLYDPDTGLVRFGARDYDPEVGRWTRKDPVKFRGRDANLLAYTFGDPINLLDPDGRNPLSRLGRLLRSKGVASGQITGGSGVGGALGFTLDVCGNLSIDLTIGGGLGVGANLGFGAATDAGGAQTPGTSQRVKLTTSAGVPVVGIPVGGSVSKTSTASGESETSTVLGSGFGLGGALGKTTTISFGQVVRPLEGAENCECRIQ